MNELTTKEKVIALNLMANLFRGVNEIRYNRLVDTHAFFPVLREIRLDGFERRKKIFEIMNESTIRLLDHIDKT